MDFEIIKIGEISGVKTEINITAITKRDELIELSNGILKVENYDEQEKAVEVMNKLKNFAKGIEEERVRVKAPVLAIGKQIDAKSKEFSVPLNEATKKISGMLSDYANELERKRRELARIEAEKQAELERKRREAEAQNIKPAEQAEMKVIVPASVSVQAKIQGARTTKVRRFEIKNLEELRVIHPEFFDLNESKLRAWAKSIEVKEGEKETLAGVELWDELEVR